ncbi:MAG: glycosyltransferase family 39 protein [Chloroflexota bacterium]
MRPANGSQGSPPEPSLLDWIKSVFRGRPIGIPTPPPEVRKPVEPAPAPPPSEPAEPFLRLTAARLRLPAALLLALVAQFGLELRAPNSGVSVVLYLLAAAIVCWAVWAGDWRDETPPAVVRKKASEEYHPWLLGVGAVLAVLTFLTSARDEFRPTTVVFWAGSLAAVMLGLWDGELSLRRAWERILGWLRRPHLRIEIDSWGVLLLISLGVAACFRYYRLSDIIPEMVSDQAEKLLDVADVLAGQYRIFFPRNTGREAFQFYMVAATARLLGTGLTFNTLKVGTITLGFLTLPYVYLFGRELGGRRAGLAAMLLAGIAYWPNIISRVGLRFTLYPAFAAPALYYFVHGLRLRRRNDMLLSGLAIGIGLNGYSPFRVVPLAVAVGLLVYLLHREARGERRALLGWLAVSAAVAVVLVVPLVRVATEMPDLVFFRQMTRLGSLERALPGPALEIFLRNQWNALRMFGWDNGGVWVIVIPGRPALDWISAALFHLGVAIALAHYIRQRHWLDLFVLLLIPILMLPSSLSLAFPEENPATNRAGAAIIPAFALAGFALAALPQWGERVWRGRIGRGLATAAALGLFLLAARNNYQLVFVEHDDLYRRSAWNTSDMGRVVRGFVDTVGTIDTAHLVGYPFWADSRLVSINAGFPTHDIAIMPEALDSLADEARPQLFIINIQDLASVEKLRSLFPEGRLSRFDSPYEGKDFFIYFVPGQIDLRIEPTPTAEP